MLFSLFFILFFQDVLNLLSYYLYMSLIYIDLRVALPLCTPLSSPIILTILRLSSEFLVLYHVDLEFPKISYFLINKYTPNVSSLKIIAQSWYWQKAYLKSQIFLDIKISINILFYLFNPLTPWNPDFIFTALWKNSFLYCVDIWESL